MLEPATPYHAKGLWLAAVADPDPVLLFERKLRYKMKGPVPEGQYTVPIGKAATRRAGRGPARVGCGIMVSRALEAALTLAGEGIDPRSLRPLDMEKIVASVKKTPRLMCVYEGVKAFGVGAEIAAGVAESEASDYLDADIVRLGGADAPVPCNPARERAMAPQAQDIVAAAR